MGLLEHLCALSTLASVLGAARFGDEWPQVPAVGDDEAPARALPPLSIIVPARNEARSIEECVRSLLAQRGVDFEVIVVNDRSTDETGAILRRLAGEDGRLRVVDGGELPAGWVGKPWALHQGARIARGEWLLFTDADSHHEPHASASTLAYALEHRADVLSIATRQELVTFWERAALPSILGIILFASGPLYEINDPTRPDRALANGQYILVSQTAYEALGGHAALRGEIAEDLEFARHIKRDGRFRFLLVGGTALVSVRMYRSLVEIWQGFTKNVYLGACGHPGRLVLGIAFLASTSIGPPLLAVRALARRRCLDAVEAACCTLTSIATASWAFRKIGLPRRLGLYQPLGTGLLVAITVNAAARVLSGRGVEWRGRRYTGRYKAESP
jgi:chlorobactene glucosyltransferase